MSTKPQSKDSKNVQETPDFIVAGATRCGTSTLYQILSSHSEIRMPKTKEIHFFDDDRSFAQGMESYAAHFERSSDEVSGDITPTYFNRGYTKDSAGAHKWSPEDDAITRMAANIAPDTQIILSLRNPIMRAQSFYARTKWQGHESADTFEQAVQEEIDGKRSPEITPLCPLYLSHYKIHVQHILKHINPKKVLIMIMEEWTAEPQKAHEVLANALGVSVTGFAADHIPTTNEGRQSVSTLGAKMIKKLPSQRLRRMLSRHLLSQKGYQSTISPALHARLLAHFEDDIAYLEGLLARPILSWRKGAS